MTQTLALYTYLKAYIALDFGYGAALAVMLMLVLAVFTIVYIQILRMHKTFQ